MTEGAPDLVYGLWIYDTFAVVGDAWAQAARVEVDRWLDATTVGEARELLALTSHIPLPFDAAKHARADASTAWSVPEELIQLSAWPGNPPAWTLAWLPPGWGIGTPAQTVLGDAILRIDPAEEAALISAAAAHGVVLRRDDDLINELGLA